MVESMMSALPCDLTPCHRKMHSDYRSMFLQYNFVDTLIVVDGKTTRVHMDILSSRCTVFAAMFNREWREQATQTVTIQDFDYKTILAMIEFIYYGGSEDDYDEEAADPVKLLKAANMYQLHHLKKKCEERLCHSIHASNVNCYIILAILIVWSIAVI